MLAVDRVLRPKRDDKLQQMAPVKVRPVRPVPGQPPGVRQDWAGAVPLMRAIRGSRTPKIRAGAEEDHSQAWASEKEVQRATLATPWSMVRADPAK